MGTRTYSVLCSRKHNHPRTYSSSTNEQHNPGFFFSVCCVIRVLYEYYKGGATIIFLLFRRLERPLARVLLYSYTSPSIPFFVEFRSRRWTESLHPAPFALAPELTHSSINQYQVAVFIYYTICLVGAGRYNNVVYIFLHGIHYHTKINRNVM